MKADYKKFIKSSLIVIVGFLLVDNIFGFIADKLTMKLPDNGGYTVAKEKRLLYNLNDDVIIIGSSRASHHFVSSILQDSINTYLNKKVSVYNGGLDGRYLDCSSLLIENLITNHQNKLLIWEIDNYSLYDNGFATIQYFAPFYHKNKIVKQYIDNLGLVTRIKMKSSLYRYNFNASFFKVLFGLVTKDNCVAGYSPLYNVMKFDPNAEEKTNKETTNVRYREVNDYLYSNFVRVMNLCKKKKVNLIVISSPNYGKNKNTYGEKQDILSKLCKERNIPYINMIDEEYFENHHELFQDGGHLNDNGAKAFTKMFFEKLKPYLDSMK